MLNNLIFIQCQIVLGIDMKSKASIAFKIFYGLPYIGWIQLLKGGASIFISSPSAALYGSETHWTALSDFIRSQGLKTRMLTISKCVMAIYKNKSAPILGPVNTSSTVQICPIYQIIVRQLLPHLGQFWHTDRKSWTVPTSPTKARKHGHWSKS